MLKAPATPRSAEEATPFFHQSLQPRTGRGSSSLHNSLFDTICTHDISKQEATPGVVCVDVMNSLDLFMANFRKIGKERPQNISICGR